MLIKFRKNHDLSEADVTPEGVYMKRRHFMKGVIAAGIGAAGVGVLGSNVLAQRDSRVLNALEHKKTDYNPNEELTPEEAVINYNNYYEFGTGKGDPSANAWRLQPKPWTVLVDGETDKPGAYALEDLIDFGALEERIYRLRCVEAWSMIVPWMGVPLADVVKKLSPTSNAKYVRFETLADSKQMPGLRIPVVEWPYVEGLRMDEAMNSLPLLAVGLYGKELPNQNGAPIRLVVPWKYGFKSIKSIVRITFTEQRPRTTWETSAPSEYGFYANVNPKVSHPRWSQARERRIGEFGRRPTLMFNGYSEEVADLYAGMDLSRYY